MGINQVFTAVDWGKCYWYLTELARQNTLDLPEGIEDWDTDRMLRKISRLEKTYGPPRVYL